MCRNKDPFLDFEEKSDLSQFHIWFWPNTTNSGENKSFTPFKAQTRNNSLETVWMQPLDQEEFDALGAARKSCGISAPGWDPVIPILILKLGTITIHL